MLSLKFNSSLNYRARISLSVPNILARCKLQLGAEVPLLIVEYFLFPSCLFFSVFVLTSKHFLIVFFKLYARRWCNSVFFFWTLILPSQMFWLVFICSDNSFLIFCVLVSKIRYCFRLLYVISRLADCISLLMSDSCLLSFETRVSDFRRDQLDSCLRCFSLFLSTFISSPCIQTYFRIHQCSSNQQHSFVTPGSFTSYKK